MGRVSTRTSVKRTYSETGIAEDRCSWKFYKLIKERERRKKIEGVERMRRTQMQMEKSQ